MNTYNLLLLTILLTITSCSNFEKLEHREIKLPGDKSVSLPNSHINFKVPANKIRIQDLNNHKKYQVTIDIGTGSQVVCNVIPQANDIANSARNYLELLKNNNPIKKVQIARINSMVIGKTPLLELDLLLTVEKDGTQKSSYLKTVYANIGNNYVGCSHDQIGYKKTFKELFKTIVDSFSSKAMPSYDYVDIQIATIKNSNVGYVAKRMSRQGDKRITFIFSTILRPNPNMDTELLAIDSIAKEVAHPKKGHVISGKYITVINSQLINNVDLTLNKSNYAVSGKYHRKMITANLKNKPLILSTYAISKNVSNKFNQGKTHYDSDEFNGFIEPTKMFKSTYFLSSKDRKNNYIVNNMGTYLKMKPSGEIYESKISMGKSLITIKQVYSDGVY